MDHLEMDCDRCACAMLRTCTFGSGHPPSNADGRGVCLPTVVHTHTRRYLLSALRHMLGGVVVSAALAAVNEQQQQLLFAELLDRWVGDPEP